MFDIERKNLPAALNIYVAAAARRRYEICVGEFERVAVWLNAEQVARLEAAGALQGTACRVHRGVGVWVL